jgi:phosphoribosylformylglycinamidine synthase subunit PurS
MKARVTVTLKPGVLDPQGQAIEGALASLGFAVTNSVRQGKIFDIDLSTDDETTARKELNDMAKKLLANMVIEDFSVQILN